MVQQQRLAAKQALMDSALGEADDNQEDGPRQSTDIMTEIPLNLLEVDESIRELEKKF
mgnify:CR=1 FL=1